MKWITNILTRFFDRFVVIKYVDKPVVVQGEIRVLQETYHITKEVPTPYVVEKPVPQYIDKPTIIEKFRDFDIQPFKDAVRQILSETTLERPIEVIKTVPKEKEVRIEIPLYNNSKTIEQAFAKYVCDSLDTDMESDLSTVKRMTEAINAYSFYLNLDKKEVSRRQAIISAFRSWSEQGTTPNEFIRLFR